MAYSKKQNTAHFITIEGIEGAGKTTAMAFVKKYLSEKGVAFVATREPGGTAIGEEIRQIFLAHRKDPMSNDAELLLMFAARAQHLFQTIVPAIEAGKWVVCDRFTDATYAYQGGGRGLDTARIAGIEQLVQGSLRPDCVLLLDVPAEVGLQRIKQRQAEDRIEQEKVEFFQRVRDMYLARALANRNRYKIIDAHRSLPEVEAQIRAVLDALL